MTAPTQAQIDAVRVLFEADAFCPSCGHNRDKSAVSSTDEGGGFHSCQKCGARWREIAVLTAAAEVGQERNTYHEWLDEIEKAKAATIERCAQWLKDEFSRRGLDGPEFDAIVSAIRALKEKP